MAAREAAVFQHELEYWCLEHCPMCRKRGQNSNVQRWQARAEGEAHHEDDHREVEMIVHRIAVGVAVANAMLERRNDPEDRPSTGQLL